MLTIAAYVKADTNALINFLHSHSRVFGFEKAKKKDTILETEYRSYQTPLHTTSTHVFRT